MMFAVGLIGLMMMVNLEGTIGIPDKTLMVDNQKQDNYVRVVSDERKSKGCQPKSACPKEAKCQPLKEMCDGELLTGKEYCKGKKCGCCVPKDWCADAAKNFTNLGDARVTAMPRKQLLSDMLKENCTVVAQVASSMWKADIQTNSGGLIVMSSLQDMSPRMAQTVLPFAGVTSIPGIPHQIFLQLQNGKEILGYVIITLDGEINYPWRVLQTLELATGNSRVQGSWKGATIRTMYHGSPGEWNYINGYTNSKGLHSQALFPVETEAPQTPVVLGEVRGMPGQTVRFNIRTKAYPGRTENWPVIGHVTTGLNIFEEMSKDGITVVTVSECGLVI